MISKSNFKNPFLRNLILQEYQNFLLWIPVLFGFGCVFYISFSANFLEHLTTFTVLFFLSLAGAVLDHKSLRSFFFIACATFLSGSFYANFYEKTFLNQTEITGKIYVDVVGKVESVKEFYNPINHLKGFNLVVSEPILYQSIWKEKTNEKKKIKTRKTKKVSNKNKLNLSSKHDSSEKNQQINLLESDTVISESEKSPDSLSPIKEEREVKKPKKHKTKKQKTKKKQKISKKKIEKDFVNLSDFQEIDREFLDYSKNFQSVAWVEFKGRKRFPNPPHKISVNILNNSSGVDINDKIAFRTLLQPPNSREFEDDFDFALDAKVKKIGAYGFVIGEAKILQKKEISNFNQWFLDLRETIRTKINNNLNGNEAAIANALLIGDQNEISKDLLEKIRNSGLAHLLSISGFHLSLAAAIFFVAIRFILSRKESLALNFDLKKIAALFAIFASFFYLKIANSPIPAQRAFLMIVFVFTAIFIGEKINPRRSLMYVALALILYNPYFVFNVSFQLSFAAILMLGFFYENLRNGLPWTKENISQRNNLLESSSVGICLNFFNKIFSYFCEIVVLSILIQIATLPFLMHSFQNIATLSFIANFLAIPLTSFFVMPLGFISLFLMPLHLEKFSLALMQKGILLIEEIAIYVSDISYSNITSPILSGFGMMIAVFGLLLFCLSNHQKLRILAIIIFISSFFTIFFNKKPILAFEEKQKFFVLYDEKEGLFFSKELKPSKQIMSWMKHFNEKEFKSLKICKKENCELDVGKKIKVLFHRHKVSEICRNDFDVIVNLTKKYKLPNCILSDKIKIDNFDFYSKGAHFLYLKENKDGLKEFFIKSAR